MAIIEWDDRYKVGIDSIDLQHHRLVDIINELDDCEQESHDSKCLEKALNDLLAYIMVHFNFEENLMEKHNYSGMSKHIELHNELKHHVAQYQNDLGRGTRIPVVEVQGFLIDWLMTHINREDRKVAHSIKNEDR
jgi:hemerythrin-like metal-binding protein